MASLSQMKKGLSLRPTYDQILLSYLSGGPDIKKPDRTARFIRESPQYQDLLKTDFIDLQKQQNNILIAQKRDVLLKEMVASGNSDMKSVKSSVNGNGDSSVYQSASDESVYQSAVDSNFESLNSHDLMIDDIFSEVEGTLEEQEQQQIDKRLKGQLLIREHLDEVNQDAERALARTDKYLAAMTRGDIPVPKLGYKKMDKHIAEGQQVDTLRVLPASSSNPPYISELSKNPANVERQRLRMGLPATSSDDLTAERRNYLESLSLTRLKAEARSSNVPIPRSMGKKDRLELINTILQN